MHQSGRVGGGWFSLLALNSLALIHLPGLGLSQTTWYVDAGGIPPGDGSQGQPYTSIQYAISRATTMDGDVILVAPATYVEAIDFLGKAIRVEGSAGALSTAITLPFGTQQSVLTFASGEGPGSILEGFTITGGFGTWVAGFLTGGGIYGANASPTLRRLVVEANKAFYGAGMYLENTTSRVTDCIIRNNTSIEPYGGVGEGAGVWVSGSPIFESCEIRSNRDTRLGGGVYGPGLFVDCAIVDNAASHGGGAMSTGTFIGCMIQGNRAQARTGELGVGGGVNGAATLIDCTIDFNSGGFNGGGVFGGLTGPGAVLQDCVVSRNLVRVALGGPYSSANGGGAYNAALTRCLVWGNKAFAPWYSSGNVSGGGLAAGSAVECSIFDNVASTESPASHSSRGGGISGTAATRCRIYGNSAMYGAGASNSSLSSCTVYGNAASFSGGGLRVSGGSVTVVDSILWGNVPEQIQVASGSAAVSFSDVAGGWSGPGNIDLDPRFWAPASGNFNLKPGSPCIDAGDPASPSDPDGSRADMGALPFVPGWCPAPDRFCLSKPNSLGCAPVIGFSGLPTATGPDDFHVTATQVLNQKPGLMFWGRAHAPPPFAGGMVCLQGTLIRTPVQFAGGSPLPAQDCSGTYDYPFTQSYMALHAVVSGETLYAQYYARDPAHPDGTGRSLSDALEFAVCP